MNNPEILLRRMRRVEHMREFIAEQHVTRHDLCHPLFIRNDIDLPLVFHLQSA
jgi:delta-aminolevulinic acid dehydratase/porphobilinogen synthase